MNMKARSFVVPLVLTVLTLTASTSAFAEANMTPCQKACSDRYFARQATCMDTYGWPSTFSQAGLECMLLADKWGQECQWACNYFGGISYQASAPYFPSSFSEFTLVEFVMADSLGIFLPGPGDVSIVELDAMAGAGFDSNLAYENLPFFPVGAASFDSNTATWQAQFSVQPGDPLAAYSDTFGYFIRAVFRDPANQVLGVADAFVAPSDLLVGSPPDLHHLGRLDQNTPNPFNPSTSIRFELTRSDYAKLAIYDISGRLVRTLVDEPRDAGQYTVPWNARNDAGERVASGVYIYRLKAGEFSDTKTMVLLQ